eukprot:Rhum_TRINITY_DN14151_c0_g3::Rhum_TRINITY_DN14151_c0_g3_i1::g.69898::m.69898/K19757/RSPH9; radial spoke head protein 9
MSDLQNTFEYVGLTGHVLTVAEQAALSCSLSVLSRDCEAPVVFWGKLEGYQTDYLLAQTVSTVPGKSVSQAALGKEKTFYSTDGGHHWTLLEGQLTDQQVQFAEQIRGKFMGNPAHEYKVRQQLPEVEEPPPAAAEPAEKGGGEEDEEREEDGEGDEDDAEEKKEEGEGDDEKKAEGEEEEAAPAAAPAPKRKKVVIVAMSEVARLAHFVLTHDHRCKVAPHGQLMLTQQNTVGVSKTFQGLGTKEAMKLSAYCHLRKPQAGGAALANGVQRNPVLDFMDPLSSDIPEGSWTLQYDPSLGVVVGKNLMFPGTVFYHQPKSRLFGQYYFGSGELNFDLCYMLP